MDNQIFVKIEDYQEVLDVVKVIQERIDKAEKTIKKINELKAQEDKELAEWNNNLKTATEKLADIQNSLSQSRKG